MKHIEFALVIFLAGQAVGAEIHQPPMIEGLSLIGSAANAKSLGFTECENKYDYYLCSRTKATHIFGTNPSRVEVLLNGKNNTLSDQSTSSGPKLSEVSLDKLSYRGVRMQYDLEEREKLTTFLKQNGWLKTGAMNSTEYFKSGVNASIKIHKFSVSLEPQDESKVEKIITSIKESSEIIKASEDQSNNFIDSMKE